MELTEEMKKKIDAYFESKSAEEVEEILKGYGLKEEKRKIVFRGELKRYLDEYDKRNSEYITMYINDTKNVRKFENKLNGKE